MLHSNGMSRTKRIVICGGGVIGVAIAYLSRRGARPIVIERRLNCRRGLQVGRLPGARLVRQRADQLARRSRAHAELADELGSP